jgi:uncharacterized protein YbbC (DUF1343 family)
MTRTGLEVLLDNHSEHLRGKHVGLLTNYASLTSAFRFALDELLERGECRHITVFAPEHGFWGDAQYMATIREDSWGQSPRVTMLRSYDPDNARFLSPDPRAVADCDVIVADIQDTGARYYTYAASLIKLMGVARDTGVPVIVCDRPNPIGGVAVEGNINFYEPYVSFIGNLPVPNRHGMTIAELAVFANQAMNIGCELLTIPMEGWRRSMLWDETALAWIPPSPNMPSPRAALLYPGTCLFEATNISEARGTTYPFDAFGAPWLDGFELAGRLNELRLDGVLFRPHVFTPTFQKHAKEVCGGVWIHVTDPVAFQPVRAGLLCLKVARDVNPERFKWRESHYEFAHCSAIDALTRSSRYQLLVERGTVDDIREWFATWEADERAFSEQHPRLAEYEQHAPLAAVARLHPSVSTEDTVSIEIPRAEA